MQKSLNKPLVCILILNYNGKELLKNCLDSLFKLTDYPNYKVIVVDNGSTDGSVEFVRKNYSNVDILALDKNYGFAEGNNRGIKYALEKYNPQYILLLNNDTIIIQREWLSEMVNFAEKHKECGVVGNVLLYDDMTVQMFGGFIDWFGLVYQGYVGIPYEAFKKIIKKSLKCAYVSFACALIRSDIFRNGILLDESKSPYFEDVDFCWKVYLEGYKTYSIPNSVIVHLSGKTFIKIEKEKKILRSYELYIHKFRSFQENLPVQFKVFLFPFWFMTHFIIFVFRRIITSNILVVTALKELINLRVFVSYKKFTQKEINYLFDFFSLPFLEFRKMNPFISFRKFLLKK